MTETWVDQERKLMYDGQPPRENVGTAFLETVKDESWFFLQVVKHVKAWPVILLGALYSLGRLDVGVVNAEGNEQGAGVLPELGMVHLDSMSAVPENHVYWVGNNARAVYAVQEAIRSVGGSQITPRESIVFSLKQNGSNYAIKQSEEGRRHDPRYGGVARSAALVFGVDEAGEGVYKFAHEVTKGWQVGDVIIEGELGGSQLWRVNEKPLFQVVVGSGGEKQVVAYIPTWDGGLREISVNSGAGDTGGTGTIVSEFERILYDKNVSGLPDPESVPPNPMDLLPPELKAHVEAGGQIDYGSGMAWDEKGMVIGATGADGTWSHYPEGKVSYLALGDENPSDEPIWQVPFYRSIDQVLESILEKLPWDDRSAYQYREEQVTSGEEKRKTYYDPIFERYGFEIQVGRFWVERDGKEAEIGLASFILPDGRVVSKISYQSKATGYWAESILLDEEYNKMINRLMEAGIVSMR